MACGDWDSRGGASTGTGGRTEQGIFWNMPVITFAKAWVLRMSHRNWSLGEKVGGAPWEGVCVLSSRKESLKSLGRGHYGTRVRMCGWWVTLPPARAALVDWKGQSLWGVKIVDFMCVNVHHSIKESQFKNKKGRVTLGSCYWDSCLVNPNETHRLENISIYF